VGRQAEQVHGLLRRLAPLGGGDADLGPCLVQGDEHLTGALVAADEPLGVVGVPAEVRRVELVGVVRRMITERAAERTPDPRPDHVRVLLTAHDRAEGVLVRLDDEVHGVGEGAVEIEDDYGPARPQ
jgi:hypothetical protein